MNAPENYRGHHLTRKAALPGSGGGLFAALLARAADRFFHAVLDRIDAGLEHGAIEGQLPDGSTRIMGGRGPGPVAKVNLRSWRALYRLIRGGSIGWYEGWAAGEWNSPDPVPVFDLFTRNRLSLGRVGRASGLAKLAARVTHRLRRNTQDIARKNIEAHYDLGNDFYDAWLDPGMTYSSGVFEQTNLQNENFVTPANAGVHHPRLKFTQPEMDSRLRGNDEKEHGDLEAAQTRKIALLLNRLNLKPDDRLLEIGCGWGSLAEAALLRCQIAYHGITLSPQQKAYADARLAGKGNANVTLTDYRDVAGCYDAIVSAEMVEAVGQEYWPAYLDCIARNLAQGGRAAIQYIRIEDDIFDAYARSADFIQRYIFPGGMLLSESRFRALAEERGLKWQDQVDYGLHYAETLRLWRARFDAAVEQGRLPAGFDAKFVRLWRYYLMYCEGGFRGGGINVAQVTLVRG
jgi:cyclopropane-fatty-acyl-phospholipid synthase